ncbi:hypothetical protein LVB77_05140 [Lysobacter sp. 5GHs7-4]|uniref:hypothetical protein n=1 Tax=Lysobacter sp. 5GHs7-4 TaxID=2904253 RepID=UPI001E3FDA8B|nr:hypothetical protein [Lysobacter sp. 5GHs7-4]UHQ24101.1 hypothetical protein LVB77_05140 [Lysobacter sp. 5GHs7-4]
MTPSPARSPLSRAALPRAAFVATLAIAAAACTGGAVKPADTGTASAAPLAADPLRELRPLCGRAYAGRIVADTPASADDPFAGKTLVMHVRDCGLTEIRVPFHVGDDRSRTWVFSAHEGRLRLKHDHRHEDGSADALTMYGGDQRKDAVAVVTKGRYEFPADTYSQDMFRAQGRVVSVPNVWAVEIDARRFVYELARPGRLFRVEFDLSQPVAPPPPPWGG